MTIKPDSDVGADLANDPGPHPKVDLRPKAAEIKSLDDLITFAYRQHGKRFSVPTKVLKSIAPQRGYASDEPRSDDHALDLLIDLSARDPFLLVPPRVLVAIEDAGAPTVIRRRLATMISEVLRRHPIFTDDELQLSLTTSPRDQRRTFAILEEAIVHASSDRLGTGPGHLKESEREKLRANAITTLAMVLAIRDRWPTHQFVTCLDAHLWRPAGKGGSREPRALLADSRTPDALAVVAETFSDRARRAEDRANDAEAYSEQAGRRAIESEAQLEATNQQLIERAHEIEQLLARIKELQGALSFEQQNRVVDRSHHVDDYEALRTRIVRMLDRQTDLLADGLHALRHGSTDITEEYLERAVDALAKNRDQLKAEGVEKA